MKIKEFRDLLEKNSRRMESLSKAIPPEIKSHKKCEHKSTTPLNDEEIICLTCGKVIEKEKFQKISNLIQSLQAPFQYVIGASLVIAQDQCFHPNILKTSFEDSDGIMIKIYKCADCGKVLSKEDIQRFTI